MTVDARFIIGTGRCGSTLLSRMLRLNPRVLELSEFFVGLDWNRRLQADTLSGAEYAALLRAPHPLVTSVLERGYLPDEVTYPFTRAPVRYSPRDPVPWPLAATLPPLTDDPDALFDDVLDLAAREPVQAPALHAERLFAFLARRLGRDAWVERSAGSLTYLGDLARAFPNARFVHLHRQGEDAALSMREHPVFRLAVMLTYQIPLGESGGNEDLAVLASDTDHASRLIAARPSAEFFGRWWSEQIRLGTGVGRGLGAGRYREVAFESLVHAPERTLGEICEFLELPQPDGWKSQAALLVDPVRVSPPLPETAEISALARACALGNELLGRSARGLT